MIKLYTGERSIYRTTLLLVHPMLSATGAHSGTHTRHAYERKRPKPLLSMGVIHFEKAELVVAVEGRN